MKVRWSDDLESTAGVGRIAGEDFRRLIAGVERLAAMRVAWATWTNRRVSVTLGSIDCRQRERSNVRVVLI